MRFSGLPWSMMSAASFKIASRRGREGRRTALAHTNVGKAAIVSDDVYSLDGSCLCKECQDSLGTTRFQLPFAQDMRDRTQQLPSQATKEVV